MTLLTGQIAGVDPWHGMSRNRTDLVLRQWCVCFGFGGGGGGGGIGGGGVGQAELGSITRLEEDRRTKKAAAPFSF